MPKSDLHIDVLGASFSIAADEDSVYLQNLLNRYKQKVEEAKKSIRFQDPLRTAILAGILVCDEEERLRALNASGEGNYEFVEIERHIEEMSEQIDKVMHDDALFERLKPHHKPGEGFVKLINTIKHYPWGSTKWIPDFLGAENNENAPWAELWMGLHPSGPSLVKDGGRVVPLEHYIHEDKVWQLGQENYTAFGSLPYLFKLLAADKPLSIQAHPNLEQARAGWARENAAGIAVDAAKRNYRDANHKPELICALSPFTAMCGFRPVDIIVQILENFACPVLGAPIRALKDRRARPEEAYPAFMRSLFALGDYEKKALSAHISRAGNALKTGAPHFVAEWELAASLNDYYPEDPGVLAPFYLNVLELEPGQAVYIPAGMLHSYVHGIGLELMASSDKVLRGGLTDKHVDHDELLSVLKMLPWTPEVLYPVSLSETFASYITPAREFVLSVMKGDADEDGEADTRRRLLQGGPVILMVTEGELGVTFRDDQTLVLRRGESAFVAAGEDRGGFIFSGNYTLYAAAPNMEG
jgi:mannose-6-phosphate isomerase